VLGLVRGAFDTVDFAISKNLSVQALTKVIGGDQT
jgi:hypothetical protein